MSSSLQLFDRGKTFLGKTIALADYGSSNHMEGVPGLFQDEDPSDRTKKLSGMQVHAVICRNDSATTLYAGELVTWQALFLGRRVDALTSDTDPTNGVAGVVDDFLPSTGVLDGDLFWLIQGGPTRAKCPATGTDLSGAIVEGDLLAAHVSQDGRVDPYLNTNTDTATGAIAGEVQNVIGVAIDAAADSTASNDLMVRFLAQLWRF